MSASGSPAPLLAELTAYVNGRVYTLDPALPVAQALACYGGRIAAVGSTEQIRALGPFPSRVIDLGGHAVVPGFTDAHIHALSLGLALGQLDLAECPSLSECLDRVRERARGLPTGRWLLGRGWNQNGWPEGRWPTREDLDAVCAGNPVALSSKDGHLLWVNSLALRAAAIGPDSADPDGGEIVRESSGQPSGLLKENATEAVYRVIPQPADAEIDEALMRMMDHALRLGVTGIGNFEGPVELRAFGRLRSSGRLRLRVTQHIAHAFLDQAIAAGLTSGLGDEWLRVGSLKLFADGTLGSQTAWMIEPFAGSAANRGIAVLSADRMRKDARRAAEAGIATAIHAIGDRANREALTALAAAPCVDAMPHRIEHAQLLHPDDLAVFARHGIVASMQPIHAVGDRDTADRYWGERYATAYAWRSLLESGAILSFGSDAPVESCDPLAGLYAATARHGIGDGREPWRPQQALSIQDALCAYTVGAAWATGESSIKGALTPGKLADFVVLSEDIVAGGAEAIAQCRVLQTVVAGEVVARES
jgi:predicted amidohydrolase YtcJ